MKNGKLDTATARQKLAESGLGDEALNISTMERETTKRAAFATKRSIRNDS